MATASFTPHGCVLSDNMNPHLVGFLGYLSKVRRVTDETIYWYRIKLQKVLPGNGLPTWACGDDLLEWLHDQKHLQESGKKGYYTALRLFYRWAENKGHCQNICKGLEPRFDSPRHRIPPTREQFNAIIDAHPTDKFWQQRNRAMYIFGFYTCARISEICSLKREHLFFEQGIVQLFGKRQKWRNVPIVPELQTFLNEWTGKYPREWIFPRTESWDAPCNRNHVSRRWTEHLKNTGEKRAWWFHDIRRAGATHLVRNGVSPFNVMGVLGHVDFATTAKYIGHDIEQIRKEMTGAFS